MLEQREKNFHRIELNENNRNFFKRYITSKEAERYRSNPVDIDYKSNRLIISNYKVIKDFIEDAYSNFWNEVYSNKDAYITDLFDVLKHKFFMVVIKVKNKKTSYLIFETLNDRGLILEDYENIKNHILGRSYEKYFEIEDMWNLMIKSYGRNF